MGTGILIQTADSGIGVPIQLEYGTVKKISPETILHFNNVQKSVELL